MDIKLIVCDLDGTLLDKDESLSEKTISVINKAEQQGTPVTFATGRLQYMIDEYADKIKLQHPVVSCNGAILYRGSEILSEKVLHIKPLKGLIEKADEMGMTVVYAIKGKEYVLRETNWVLKKRKAFDRYHDVHFIDENDWETMQVNKVNIVDEVRNGRVRELHVHSNDLEEKCTISHYGNVGMEIVSNGITKATGLEELSQMMNIPVSQMMAIGDSENDNAMLKAAGLGVAVGNAMPSTKESADYICKNHGAAGVAEAIEKFVHAKKIAK